jgi:hypothetical protein
MQWKLAAVGGVLCLAAGGGLVHEHLDTLTAQNVATQQQHQQNLSAILPDTPQKVLRFINQAIAEKDTVKACSMFEQAERPAVARALGAGSCESAMANFAQQVKDVNEFVEFNVDEAHDVVLEGDTGASINGCNITFGGGLLGPPVAGDPGPKIGRLHMKRILNRGLLVDGLTPCTPTPGTSPSARPGDTGSVSLPTTPRAPVDALLNYLAQGSADGCQLFSDAGKAAFAKAQGTSDCPAAVTAFRGRITDPRRYGEPIGGDVNVDQQGSGTFAADACKLVWAGYTMDGELPPPGPQLGRLVIEHPPGNAGAYWISGYAHC